MGVAVELEVRDVGGGAAVEDEFVEDFEGGGAREVRGAGVGGTGGGGRADWGGGGG